MSDAPRTQDFSGYSDPMANEEQDSTVESVIGRAKEAVGAATGADDLRDEGREQQNKADAQDKVAEKEKELAAAKAQEKAHAAREENNRRD